MVYTRTGLPIITKQNKQTTNKKHQKQNTNKQQQQRYLDIFCVMNMIIPQCPTPTVKFSVAILNISFVNNFAKPTS